MATAAEVEVRDDQLRRVAELEEQVARVAVPFENVGRAIEKLRASEARLVQRHGDASRDAERTYTETVMKGIAAEAEKLQQLHDDLETELCGCKEQLREARLACVE